MKKILTAITSAVLCMAMLFIAPTQVIASAAESNAKKYISEVKVGMGVTSDEASKELLAEGYTILANDQGEYANLNEGAGAKSPLKQGPNQKIVYLGYKTTDNAKDAVTDLAVMNMRGGYSFEDYETLMNNHMNTRIKPFVDRFIATLNEYRENLKKPQDSANYKRANYYKTLLNKLTDDDTGNRPLGDLLVNQTKYEMGDEAYNKLSDTEKKNHCDILTLLMQGNGQAVQLMETELTKAADSSDTTWLDRFVQTDLNSLSKEIKDENPTLTPTEINKELDKKYNDAAKKIRDKWSAFNEVLLNYDDANDRADELLDEMEEEADKKEVKLSDNPTKEEVTEVAAEAYNSQGAMIKAGRSAEDIAAHDFLEVNKYGKGTLLEFFQKNAAEFSSEKNIRNLYPMVDALSDGQLAGLDFLSIKDLMMIAISIDGGFDDVDSSKMESASIFQDVNREIYEKGGVALTNEALRAKAAAQQTETTFELSKLGCVLWGCTAFAGMAAAGSLIIGSSIKPTTSVTRTVNKIVEQRMQQLQNSLTNAQNDYLRFEQMLQNDPGNSVTQHMLDMREQGIKSSIKNIENYSNTKEYQNAMKEVVSKSNISRYIAAGFTIAMAFLAGYSIYTTITEMMEYYKVDFSPIPKYIVEQADITEDQTINGKKQTVMIQNQTAYYKVVTCNRTDGGGTNVEKKNHEILKDCADLNGDVGKQWLALYSVKYKNGTPILADSLKVKLGDGPAPEGYDTGIHMFGETAAQNLTTTKGDICYNDPNEGTYVFFKRDVVSADTQTAGSVFSGGSLVLGAVIGLAAGCLITFVITRIVGKKKKEKAE